MNTPEVEKILVALSGGVDSSVAAALLVEQGHDVHAAYMKNWINEDNIIGDCPWMQDIEDASAVAETLGIPFEVINLMEEYKDRVVKYLLDGYQNGVTPNPDVMCNREIKFGAFLQYAIDQGYDAVATGHYARTQLNEDGTRDILQGLDPNKDQTYFLALMQQHQIKYARFPIGEMLKPDVRKVAERFNLPTASKKDSQGICFIGQIKMADFLKTYVENNPGDIVNQAGEKLGRHEGLHLYTLGQRKGIGIASPVYKEAYVVVEKNAARNELVIALDRPDTPKLYASRCHVNNISVTNKPLDKKVEMQARPRYRCASQDITFVPLADGNAEVVFKEPQRALAPGQIIAFYQKDVLVGGGIFESIDYE